MRIRRLITLIFFIFGAAVSTHAMAAEEADRTVVLYKNPLCGCCETYAQYLREEGGFKVTVKATHDLSLIKRQHGVPTELAGCHTSLIDGYVVEGHVPLATIDKLLTERPDIRGISLPGMPTGSPGMNGPKLAPFTIHAFSEAGSEVYAVE